MTTEETKKPLIVDPAKIKTIVVDDDNAGVAEGSVEAVPPQRDEVEAVPPQRDEVEAVPPQRDEVEAVPPQQ